MDKAALVYHRAVLENSTSVHARIGLASTLYQLGTGNSSDAVRAYDDVIKLDPAHAASHATIGLLHAELGDVDAAFQGLRAAVSYQPSSALFTCVASKF